MLARWQFGITTVYHFLFVPLTIGLAFTVAGFQTAWYRTGKEKYLRLTRFFGELFLINFAIGAGHRHRPGVPVRHELEQLLPVRRRHLRRPAGHRGPAGLLPRVHLPGPVDLRLGPPRPRVHLATIWIAALGTLLSAYFILAANSWMQHPVGYEVNPVTGRAELTDFLALLTNNTALIAFPHTIAAAFMITGRLPRGDLDLPAAQGPGPARGCRPFRSAAKAGAVMLLVSGLLVAITGDIQGKIMTEQQPMKMAAAEALWETEQPASFSIFTIGTPDGSEDVFSIRIPDLLSFLATGTFDGKVKGINDLQAQSEAQYGPGDYTPSCRSPTGRSGG